MIVGSRYYGDAIDVTWICSSGALCNRAVRCLNMSTGISALLIVRSDELCALMIKAEMPSDGKVVKVSNVLECSRILNCMSTRMIDADTYIHMPTSMLERCMRIKIVGNMCSVEGVSDGDMYWYYDGERFWRSGDSSSGGKIYISSDPAYSFEIPTPRRFGFMADARNGLVLNYSRKVGAEGRYTIHILCSRTRDVIWSYESAIGEHIEHASFAFVTDNVVFAEQRYTNTCVFINMADNTAYELAFCG